MKPVMDDEEAYSNPEGWVVFTAEYLLQRGYCCGNGCTNCPYNYKAVPEPRRSLLLQNKNDNLNPNCTENTKQHREE